MSYTNEYLEWDEFKELNNIDEMLEVSMEDYMDDYMDNYSSSSTEKEMRIPGESTYQSYMTIIREATCMSHTEIKCLAKVFNVSGHIDEIKPVLERLVADIDAIDLYPEYLKQLSLEIDRNNLMKTASIEIENEFSMAVHERKECDCYLN